MLDFIRDWGGFVPLLVLVWVALAYGVAWWRTRRGFFGVQALINGMWAIFFFFQQASSNRNRASLFFILVVVIGAMAVPFLSVSQDLSHIVRGVMCCFFAIHKPMLPTQCLTNQARRNWLSG